MDPKQFNDFILVPTLKALGLFTPASNVLMLGTALVESNLDFVEQIGPGTAMGIYQMEEATYRDILRYLNRFDNSRLKERCIAACYYNGWPSSDALMHNLKWATICARLKYWMHPDPLPSSMDAKQFARYHKEKYNTSMGKTDTDESTKVFEHVISLLNL